MGRQIIQQPNGKFAIWSTNSDAIFVWDATEDEVVEYFIRREAKRTEDDVRQIISELRNGANPYFQFQMTWEEALKAHEERHGPLSGAEIRR